MLLQAYLQTLLVRLQKGTEELLREAMEVSRLLFLLQRDVVTSQCHVWLAQSRLTSALKSTFANHPRADVWPRG